MKKNPGLIKTLKHLGSTIECGLHSNIPACCIKFYITTWMWIPKEESNKLFKSHFNKILKTECGYIACPDCLKNKSFIKIKRCPKNKHCFHADEQAFKKDIGGKK